MYFVNCNVSSHLLCVHCGPGAEVLCLCLFFIFSPMSSVRFVRGGGTHVDVY